MMYGSRDIARDGCKKNLETSSFILYICKENYDQMMCGPQNRAGDICNCYFSFWSIFFPFILLITQKVKIKEIPKKYLEISSFWVCVPKIIIR